MSADVAQKHLWSFERSCEIDYVNRMVTDDRKRALCYSVVDSIIEIREFGIVEARHVEVFSAAARHSNEFVFVNGGSALVRCSRFSELAAEALRRLMRDSQWRPRFNVMCVLGTQPCENLALELLAIGLTDKSEKVAIRAADACDNVDFPAALDLLKVRLLHESRPKVCEAIEFTIGLMETPWVRNGRREERRYRGITFSRDARRGRKENS